MKIESIVITKEYLESHPDHIFVFGDNLIRRGKGGAATFRDEPNSYGFITKRYPNNRDSSFYEPIDYEAIFWKEVEKLKQEIQKHPEQIYLISKLGAGLANRFHIYEAIIEPNLPDALKEFDNVIFLWSDTNVYGGVSYK